MLLEYFTNMFDIILKIWIPVLVGFIIAGLINISLPKNALNKHFKKNNVFTIIMSSLLGVILSACYIGAVPIIASLRKKGASTAACLTMLLSSPWAGVTNLLIINHYIGATNALLFFITSISIALISGAIFSLLENAQVLDNKKSISINVLKSCDCESGESFLNKKQQKSLDKKLLKDFPKEILNISIGTGKFLIIGLLLAALLKTLAPPSIIVSLFGAGNDVFSILYTVPLASLVELYSEGFTALAGEMYLLGANLGVVFTMIMVGVTTDITELSMIRAVFGKKTLIYYVVVSLGIVILTSTMINVFI